MKKGIMFSLIIIFIATTLVGLITIQRSLITYSRENIYVETRINAINSHYDSIMRDLRKTIETVTQRAIIVCLTNISTDLVPLRDANVTLKELIINGTFDQQDSTLMHDATIEYWINKIKDISLEKGFDVYIDTGLINNTLEIKPFNSFYLLADAKMQINITDLQGVAHLNRTVTISKLISIEGMGDPLYLIHSLASNEVKESPYIGNYTELLMTGTGGNNYVYGVTTTNIVNFNGKILIVDDASTIPNLDDAEGVICRSGCSGTIRPYIVSSNALNLPENMNVLLDGDNGKVWYIDNLKDHLANHYYQPSAIGPSFLDRLEGNLTKQTKYSSQSNNEIGLESFVKKIGPSMNEYTNVDYLYVDNVNGNEVKGISDISNSFRIDVQHESIYNATDIIE